MDRLTEYMHAFIPFVASSHVRAEQAVSHDQSEDSEAETPSGDENAVSSAPVEHHEPGEMGASVATGGEEPLTENPDAETAPESRGSASVDPARNTVAPPSVGNGELFSLPLIEMIGAAIRQSARAEEHEAAGASGSATVPPQTHPEDVGGAKAGSGSPLGASEEGDVGSNTTDSSGGASSGAEPDPADIAVASAPVEFSEAAMQQSASAPPAGGGGGGSGGRPAVVVRFSSEAPGNAEEGGHAVEPDLSDTGLSEYEFGACDGGHGSHGGDCDATDPTKKTAATDADAMAVLLGGSATAAGFGASTTGEVNLEFKDLGPLTIAYGQATYTAEGSEGASADSYALVTGADYVVTFTIDHPVGFGPFGSVAEQSTTFVFAIDWEEEAFAEAGNPLLGSSIEQWFGGPEQTVETIGNTASSTGVAHFTGGQDDIDLALLTVSEDGVGSSSHLQAAADDLSLSLIGQAWGEDTLAWTDGTAIQIEDEYSSINGSVVGIG